MLSKRNTRTYICINFSLKIIPFIKSRLSVKYGFTADFLLLLLKKVDTVFAKFASNDLLEKQTVIYKMNRSIKESLIYCNSVVQLSLERLNSKNLTILKNHQNVG